MPLGLRTVKAGSKIGIQGKVDFGGQETIADNRLPSILLTRAASTPGSLSGWDDKILTIKAQRYAQ